MCVHICEGACMSMCAYVCGGQRTTCMIVIFRSTPLRQGFVLADASQQIPAILLPPLSQGWDYKHMLLCLSVETGELKFSSLGLQHKHPTMQPSLQPHRRLI